jgi:hypothetical protein
MILLALLCAAYAAPLMAVPPFNFLTIVPRKQESMFHLSAATTTLIDVFAPIEIVFELTPPYSSSFFSYFIRSAVLEMESQWFFPLSVEVGSFTKGQAKTFKGKLIPIQTKYTASWIRTFNSSIMFVLKDMWGPMQKFDATFEPSKLRSMCRA